MSANDDIAVSTTPVCLDCMEAMEKTGRWQDGYRVAICPGCGMKAGYKTPETIHFTDGEVQDGDE